MIQCGDFEKERPEKEKEHMRFSISLHFTVVVTLEPGLRKKNQTNKE